MKNKEPFYFNEEQYLRDKKHLETQVPKLQTAIDAYYKIEGIPNLAANEIESVFNDTTALLSKKVIEMYGVNFNGLEIKEDRLFEMFKKPAGVDDFLNAVEEAQSVFKLKGIFGHDSIYSKDYELTGKSVRLKDETVNRIKTGHSRFIENEKQEKAHALLCSISKSFNELRELMGGHLEYKDIFENALGLKRHGISAANNNTEIDPHFICDIK